MQINKTLSIIIPVYNEEKTILTLLGRVVEISLANIEKEIIVVDDASKDKSHEKLLEYKKNNSNVTLEIIQHKKNKGKGAAIRNGIKKATGDFILIQDADLEYNPKEYPLLLKPVLDNEADVVYGSRFLTQHERMVHYYWHAIGNKLLTMLSNMFSNLNLSDMETCYKLFRSEIIKGIAIEENRFGFEPEITAKISKIPNIKIYEIGISYHGRTYNEGKKINWKDGCRAIWCILKYNLSN